MTKSTLRTKSVRRKHAAKSRAVPREARGKKLDEVAPAAPATPAAPPAEAPKPEILPFDCGEVNRAATLLTLVEAMLDAPDMSAEFDDRGTRLMANVLHTVADEAELINAANNGLDLSEVKNRAGMRLEYRARIAVEIARRIQAGEVTS
ncbi:MAG TPA: hypothetical protein VH062_19420 [Polyangiaceae bacterium]|jgi:hypothetical protein|nr:hypothetical protein [Polyangiaceae bacterium]